MTVGLYRDLAVGVDAGGAEMWAQPDWFMPGVAIGAPPDLLGPDGQNWGLPPFNPETLKSRGFRRSARCSPPTCVTPARSASITPSSCSACLSFPRASGGRRAPTSTTRSRRCWPSVRLESHRARAIVIAEDLGTAPEGFSDAIMASDLLSYRILSFEREDGGGFKPPSAYPRKALVAVATHDLPTFAGWWQSSDTSLRETVAICAPEQARTSGRAGRRYRAVHACRRGRGPAASRRGAAARRRSRRPRATSRVRPRCCWPCNWKTCSATSTKPTCPARIAATPIGNAN